MRCNLKNAVCGGVNNGLAGGFVLAPVVKNDLCAAVRLVAEHLKPGGGGECVQNLLREAVGIGGKRPAACQPRKLPVTGGGVLAHANLVQSGEGACRRRRFFNAVNAVDVAKTCFYHIRNVQLTRCGARSKGIAAFVTEPCGVR